jgi:uncharacterized damage-inducible protein DinB
LSGLLLNLARYDTWANRELLATVVTPAASDERVLRLWGHVVLDKRIWLARVRGEDTMNWELWPRYSVSESDLLLRQADQEMLALASNAGTRFDRLIHYRNQTGKYFDTSLSDIFVHIVNHATYHRGQLATAIKAANGTPANTDYIAWIRAGSPLAE